MLARFGILMVRHPWGVLAVVSVLTALAAVVAPQIKFDFTPQAIFSGNEDLLSFSEEFNRTFGFEENSLLIVLEATGKQDLLDTQALTWHDQLAREAAELPRVTSVQGLTTVQISRLRLLGKASGPLVDEWPVTDESAKRARAALARSPLVTGSLVSTDRRLALLILSLDPEARDIDSMRSVVDGVRGLLKLHPPPEGINAWLSGLPALRVDIVEELQKDQRFLLPLAALVQLAMLFVVFRTLSGTLVPIAAVSVGLAWTTGILSASGQSFNVISNILPVLLLTVGISNCVHVISRYSEEFVQCHQDRLEAAKRTMAHMAIACMLTLSTNAIGFLSLFTAQSELLRNFAWQAAVGNAAIYFSLMAVLGAILPFFQPPTRGIGDSDASSKLARLMALVADAIARRPIFTMLASAAVVAVFTYFGTWTKVNSQMLETYSPGHPTVRAIELVERDLGGFVPLEVSLKFDRPDRLLDPATFARIEALQAFALKQPGVLYARSYVDLFRDVHSQMTLRPSADMSPVPKNLSSRDLTIAEMVSEENAETMSYRTFMSADKLQARVLLRVSDLGTRRTLELNQVLEEELKRLFPADSGVTPQLTGVAYVNAIAMDRFIHTLQSSIFTASFTILAVVALGFRSIRIGLIAAIPNLSPLLITLGYIGLRGYDLNVGNVIIFTISQGMAVDDTIHFLSRFQEEMHKTGDRHRAIHATFLGTGRAIVLTTTLLIVGVSVLLLSDFVPTRRFAELICVTMAAGLIGDIVLLPASLMLFWKEKK